MKSLFAAVLLSAALPVWAGHCNSDHGDKDHDVKGHDGKGHSGQMTSAPSATTDMDGYLEVAQEATATTESVEEVAEEKPKSRYSKYYR